MSETQTPSKKRQMTFSVLEDKSVRVDFGEGIDPISFAPASLPESLFPDAVAKGVIARLQSYSSSLQGDDRTPANLRIRTLKGLEDLRNGIWVAEREVAPAELSIEAEAAHLFRIMRGEKLGQPYTGTKEETAESYNALPDGLAKDPAHGDAPTPKSKAALKATTLYKTAYAKVKAERQAAKAEKLAKKSGEDFDF